MRASVRKRRYAPVCGSAKVRVWCWWGFVRVEGECSRPRPPPPFRCTAEEPPVAARVPVAAVFQAFASDEEPGEDTWPGREKKLSLRTLVEVMKPAAISSWISSARNRDAGQVYEDIFSSKTFAYFSFRCWESAGCCWIMFIQSSTMITPSPIAKPPFPLPGMLIFFTVPEWSRVASWRSVVVVEVDTACRCAIETIGGIVLRKFRTWAVRVLFIPAALSGIGVHVCCWT